MKNKRNKRVRRTLEEIHTAEERRALLELVKQRRGVRIDFSGRKLNSRNEETGKLRKIVRCSDCGCKGVLSEALFPSKLIIHRGTLRDNKFKMTEFCVCSGLNR